MEERARKQKFFPHIQFRTILKLFRCHLSKSFH